MSFSAGGGSSSISGRGDVFLSNVADDQVLSYDQSVSKWRNIAFSGLPDGGATDQILVKQTNSDFDVEWVSKGVLASATPQTLGVAAAGAAVAAARSDHAHELPAGIGYPLDPSGYTNPLGSPSNISTDVAANKIRVSPFPVFRTFRVSALVPGLLGNTGARSVDVAVYASNPTNWRPAARVGGVLTVTLTDNTYAPSEPVYGGGLELTPGMYWVAVRAIGSTCRFSTLENKALANAYHTHEGFNAGSSTFYYNGTYTSMPSTLVGNSVFLDNQTPFFFNFKPL